MMGSALSATNAPEADTLSKNMTKHKAETVAFIMFDVIASQSKKQQAQDRPGPALADCQSPLNCEICLARSPSYRLCVAVFLYEHRVEPARRLFRWSFRYALDL